MPEKLPIAGAVLSGGRSSRMGRPKDLLELPSGLTMLEHVVKTVGELFDSVVIAGPERRLGKGLAKQIHFVPDEHPGCGPLSGIEAILESGVADAYIIVACDQPYVTGDLLNRLIPSAAISMGCYKLESELYPLPGYFHSGLLCAVRYQLGEDKRYSLKQLHDTVAGATVEAEPGMLHALSSINTPYQYDQLNDGLPGPN